MRWTLVASVLVMLLCGCKGGGSGDPDAEADSGPDTVPDPVDDGWSDPSEDAPGEPECAVDGDCDDHDPCTADSCDTGPGDCVHEPVDADGDGYRAARVDGVACGGTDCDDAEATAHPGAQERSCFDGIDDACDGITGPQLLQEDVVYSPGERMWGFGLELSWTGSEYAVLGVDDSGVCRFYRMTPDGTMIGDVQSAGMGDPRCAMDWSGSVHGIVWPAPAEDGNCHFTILDADGTVVSADTVLGEAVSASPDVVWTGSEFAVTWFATPTTGDRLAMARVGADGTLIHGATVVEDADRDHGIQGLVWNGSELATAWGRLSAIGLNIARFDVTGSVTTTPHFIDGQRVDSENALAWTGERWALVHDHMSNVAVTFVSPDATTQVVDVGPTQSSTPTMEWTGSRLGLVWANFDSVALEETIMFVEILQDGTIPGAPVVLADGGLGRTSGLAWTGSEYGFVRIQGGVADIVFNRIGWCR